MTSAYPVIWGVPPPPGSAHANGRRQFADGRIDRAGLARLTGSAAPSPTSKPAAATRRKKQKEDSSEPSSSETDSDASESPPPARKVRPRRKVGGGADDSGQGLDDSIFRRVAVPISTTPVKSRPAGTASPEHISISDCSSGDESDEYRPGPSKSRTRNTMTPTRGHKRKVEALDDDFPDIEELLGEPAPSPEATSRPSADEKGKRRADAVGKAAMPPLLPDTGALELAAANVSIVHSTSHTMSSTVV